MAGRSWWERRTGVRPAWGLALAVVALAGAWLASGAEPGVTPKPTTQEEPPSFTVATFGCLAGERLGENADLSADGRVLTYGVDWWYEVSRRNPLGELYGTRGPLLDCILVALDAPPGTRAAMDGTAASDGLMTSSWPGVRAEWTHEPDRGIVATFTSTS